MPRINYRVAQESVFAIFQIVGVWAIGLALTFWLTNAYGRNFISYLHELSTDGVVAMLAAIYHDIWLVPAFIICGLLVWSIPWESIFSDVQTQPFNFIRGRQVQNQRTAKVLAYNEIMNARASRERKKLIDTKKRRASSQPRQLAGSPVSTRRAEKNGARRRKRNRLFRWPRKRRRLS